MWAENWLEGEPKWSSYGKTMTQYNETNELFVRRQLVQRLQSNPFSKQSLMFLAKDGDEAMRRWGDKALEKTHIIFNG